MKQQQKKRKQQQSKKPQLKISVIITSFKEPQTIGKCIKCIADPEYSGIPTSFEIIQVSPDEETLSKGKKVAKSLGLGKKYKQIIDPQRGKPFALQLAFNQAQGDIFIMTDGDTYFEENAIKFLLEPFAIPKIGGTTGHPIALNNKETFMNYIGNLLVDAADFRRRTALEFYNENFYISDRRFFPLSGYIMAIRKTFATVPKETLSDDAYISYVIRNKGYEVAYCHRAKCYIKTPTTVSDYLKQKVRSLGGYQQLKQMQIMQRDKQTRGFFQEIPFTLFVLFIYPQNIREFFWSILLHFLRLYTWLLIFNKRILRKEGMPKSGWERIESTK